MNVIEFKWRIMKIIKIIEFHENLKFHRDNRKTHEDHIIQIEHHENH